MTDKEKLALFVILGFSLIFHLVVLLNSSFTFYSDDAIYAELAQFWLSGNWDKAFHPFWPPLFPAISALVYFFTQSWGVSLRLVSAISGVVLSIPLFFLVKKALSSTHAILFALSVTFFTPILDTSLAPLSDMLASLFLVSSVVCVFLALDKKETRLLAWSGGLAGLAFLTRPEGVMFFSLTLAYLLIYFGVQVVTRKGEIKQAATSILLFAAIFTVTASPYLLSSRMQLDKWALSPKSSAQIQQEHAFALRENGNTWAQEVWSVIPNHQSTYFSGGTSYLLKNIIWFGELFDKKFEGWQKIFVNTFPTWSLPLMAVGVLSVFRNRFRWELGYLLFLLIVAIPTTIFVTPLAKIRYVLWSFPLFLFFFYLGTNTILQLIKGLCPLKRACRSFFVALPLVASLLFPSFHTESLARPLYYAQTWTQTHTREEILQASLWIRENTTYPNPRIAMRHEGIEFYTMGETVYLPQTTYEKMLKYVKSRSVDYIAAWDGELAADKELSILLTDQDHPGLQKVYQYPESYPRIIIYQLGD